MLPIDRQVVLDVLETELGARRIKDYCPNGLQVEGRPGISKVITGVTASQKLLDVAVAANADLVLVHHGYFWKGEADIITGMKKRRLQTLLKHDINLVAYHLPLDIHPTLGNNAQLGQLLQLQQLRAIPTAEPLGVLMQGDCAQPISAADFAERISQQLGRQVLLHESKAASAQIRTVAWCSGGGQGYLPQAAAAGADLFFSGEVSEQTIHQADELGIHFIAAGHHATERYGIKALGEWLAMTTGLTVEFVDLDNPA